MSQIFIANFLIFIFLPKHCLSLSHNQLQDAIDLISKVSSTSNSNYVCRTWVYVYDQWGLPYPSTPTDLSPFLTAFLHIRVGNLTALSYTTEYEHTTEELFFPTYSGAMRHSPQCQVVLVVPKDQGQSVGQLTLNIVQRRLVRPHKDYFFYFTPTEALRLANILGELRHIYWMTTANSSAIYQKSCVAGNSAFGATKGEMRTLFTFEFDQVLNGKHIRVSAMLGNSFVRIPEPSTGEGPSGLFALVLQDASRHFNFTFSVHLANQGGASGFKKDGRWYGAVGEVYHNAADIGVGLGMTSTRDGVIDNGISFEENKRVFFIKDQILRSSWKAIFSPFQAIVWFLLLSTAICLIPAYYFSLRLHLAWGQSGSILSPVILSLAAVLYGQSFRLGRLWGGDRIRFLVMLWVLSCLVTGAGYRSRLVYFLTFITPDEEIPRTHVELVRANYKILFRNYGGIAYKFAKESQDRVQMEIFKRAAFYNSSESCILAAILVERSACLDWEIHGGYTVATNATLNPHDAKSLLIKSTDSVLGTLLAWVYRKGSPWRGTFDSYLIRVLASGLYIKWRADDWRLGKVEGAKWLRRQNADNPLNQQILQVFNEYSTTPRPLPLVSIYGMLGLLLLGSIAAFIGLVREIIPGPKMIKSH